MDVEILQNAIDIMTPVLEGAMIAAAHYAKACGRDTVTSMDVQYGMRYCAQHCVGKHIGTLFPELEAEGSDSDNASSIEEVDEDDEPFTKYSGDDEIMNTMNASYDNWAQWVPESIIEIMLKDAIDKNN